MECSKQLLASKLDNICSKDKLLKLTQVDIKCLNSSVTTKDITLVTKNVLQRKAQT